MRLMMKAGLVAAAAAAIAACGGSTTFQSTWSDPGSGQLKLEEGEKVIVFFATENTAKRRGLETALVNELNEHAVEGIASYSILPEEVGSDAGKGKPHIEKSGAAYALVMQITGQDQQITGTPSMGMGGFYGPGWGGWGWGWGGGTDIRTDTLVGVQTLLYDLKADKLVWAGQSETMNPSKAESFARELIRAVGNELQKAGLVGPPKKS
jgi:hypothetical protein